MSRPSRYKPISDYGAIGNLRTVALVARDGSIDWCCFPHMDSASVFAAILDVRRGGCFRVGPVGGQQGEQSYLTESNVLQTRFHLDGAQLILTDFMPLWGDLDARNGSEAPPVIHRLLRCEGGEAEIELEWSPRFDYARAPVEILPVDRGWLARGGGRQLWLTLTGGPGRTESSIEDRGNGPTLHARLRLAHGERVALVASWESEAPAYRLEESEALLQRTLDCWRAWVRREGDVPVYEWAGSWLPRLIRSELALKLLTHADTCAIAAAPTTSLPEEIGGVRNWDYRFSWIRDSAYTAQAFTALGHHAEAVGFLSWIEQVSQAKGDERNLQIMYGFHGETELTEKELPHLEGYRGSRPVRIGNGAAQQRQLDIYGELLESAYELLRRGQALPEPLPAFLRAVVDEACRRWHQPDEGIWEVRSGRRHFVYSKLMCWVALDRAICLAEQYGLPGKVDQWRRTEKRLRRLIVERGYDPELGSFVRSFGSRQLDAANLLIPLQEFLPFEDPRVQGTIDRTLERLTVDGLVYRYSGQDGLPGDEGAFGICTFWLVDALALSGRLDEAWEIFEGIAGRANHLGLFPEQFNPDTGEFLGNFPQAYTHIGLINSLLYLAHAEGRRIPGPPPIGTVEHRKEMWRPDKG